MDLVSKQQKGDLSVNLEGAILRISYAVDEVKMFAT